MKTLSEFLQEAFFLDSYKIKNQRVNKIVMVESRAFFKLILFLNKDKRYIN